MTLAIRIRVRRRVRKTKARNLATDTPLRTSVRRIQFTCEAEARATIEPTHVLCLRRELTSSRPGSPP
eukprot:2202415-Prymnesium_polylepis.2